MQDSADKAVNSSSLDEKGPHLLKKKGQWTCAMLDAVMGNVLNFMNNTLRYR